MWHSFLNEGFFCSKFESVIWSPMWRSKLKLGRKVPLVRRNDEHSENTTHELLKWNFPLRKKPKWPTSRTFQGTYWTEMIPGAAHLKGRIWLKCFQLKPSYDNHRVVRCYRPLICYCCSTATTVPLKFTAKWWKWLGYCFIRDHSCDSSDWSSSL